MSLGEFLHMGGYGSYVWSAYGIAFVVLVFNAIQPIIQKRQLLTRIVRKQQQDRRRNRS